MSESHRGRVSLHSNKSKLKRRKVRRLYQIIRFLPIQHCAKVFSGPSFSWTFIFIESALRSHFRDPNVTFPKENSQ